MLCRAFSLAFWSCTAPNTRISIFIIIIIMNTLHILVGHDPNPNCSIRAPQSVMKSRKFKKLRRIIGIINPTENQRHEGKNHNACHSPPSCHYLTGCDQIGASCYFLITQMNIQQIEKTAQCGAAHLATVQRCGK